MVIRHAQSLARRGEKCRGVGRCQSHRRHAPAPPRHCRTDKPQKKNGSFCRIGATAHRAETRRGGTARCRLRKLRAAAPPACAARSARASRERPPPSTARCLDSATREQRRKLLRPQFPINWQRKRKSQKVPRWAVPQAVHTPFTAPPATSATEPETQSLPENEEGNDSSNSKPKLTNSVSQQKHQHQDRNLFPAFY